MIEKDIDLDALVQRLGKVGAINYIMSINRGSGDCVKDKHERDAMFEKMGVTVADIADAIRQQSKNP